MSDIKVLALDLDGTLTTRTALDAAIEKGVTIVLASGRPTAGIQPLAEELGLDKKGGCILSYNGGKIVDCRTGETLVEKTLDPALVPELCAFAAAQDIAILTYNREGIVCERDKDEWANKECFTTKLPMIHVDDLASYVNYPVCKMLITLDPARRDAVCAAGQQQFAGRADLYPSSPFFIEAVPQGVAKDGSLAELLRRMGLTRENLMACGDGLNDRSMIAYAGKGLRRLCDHRRQQPRRRGRGRGEVYFTRGLTKQCRVTWFYLIWNGTSATSRIPLTTMGCSRPCGARSWRSAP